MSALTVALLYLGAILAALVFCVGAMWWAVIAIINLMCRHERQEGH
jgi:hypothetical protein